MHVQNHNNNFINVQSSIVHHIRLTGYQQTRGGKTLVSTHTHLVVYQSIGYAVFYFSLAILNQRAC